MKLDAYDIHLKSRRFRLLQHYCIHLPTLFRLLGLYSNLSGLEVADEMLVKIEPLLDRGMTIHLTGRSRACQSIMGRSCLLCPQLVRYSSERFTTDVQGTAWVVR